MEHEFLVEYIYVVQAAQFLAQDKIPRASQTANQVWHTTLVVPCTTLVVSCTTLVVPCTTPVVPCGQLVDYCSGGLHAPRTVSPSTTSGASQTVPCIRALIRCSV